jgi:hypothetical protein
MLSKKNGGSVIVGEKLNQQQSANVVCCRGGIKCEWDKKDQSLLLKAELG